MPQISDFLDAARTIRPLLPTVVDTETAQQIDQQLAATLNQTHIPLVMEGKKQLRNRRREEIVALAGEREEI